MSAFVGLHVGLVYCVIDCKKELLQNDHFWQCGTLNLISLSEAVIVRNFCHFILMGPLSLKPTHS